MDYTLWLLIGTALVALAAGWLLQQGGAHYARRAHRAHQARRALALRRPPHRIAKVPKTAAWHRAHHQLQSQAADAGRVLREWAALPFYAGAAFPLVLGGLWGWPGGLTGMGLAPAAWFAAKWWMERRQRHLAGQLRDHRSNGG